MAEPSGGALAGLRVLDIASLYAAPLAATFLADFGADVVKVEPPEGDGFRGTKVWPIVARNKRSVTLDLRTAEGCEALRALVAQADVLVENYPVAVLERRGLNWATLSAINPRLVMLSVSCFGATGPYAGRPGSGTIGEGFGGLTHLTGAADGPPMLPSIPLGDCMGAMSAAIGVLTALYWRQSSGRGQHVDASLYEPVLQAVAFAARTWAPGRSPRRSGSTLPGQLRNVYATADGAHVCISASTARHERTLVDLAGGGGSDADAEVAAWIVARPLTEVLDTLVAARVPVTAVNDLDRMLADPHITARGSLIRASSPALGEMLLAAPAPRLGTTPGRVNAIEPPLDGAGSALWSEWGAAALGMPA